MLRKVLHHPESVNNLVDGDEMVKKVRPYRPGGGPFRLPRQRQQVPVEPDRPVEFAIGTSNPDISRPDFLIRVLGPHVGFRRRPTQFARRAYRVASGNQ